MRLIGCHGLNFLDEFGRVDVLEQIPLGAGLHENVAFDGVDVGGEYDDNGRILRQLPHRYRSLKQLIIRPILQAQQNYIWPKVHNVGQRGRTIRNSTHYLKMLWHVETRAERATHRIVFVNY